MEIKVTHNSSARRFEAQAGDSLALLDYDRANGTMTLVHTEVPPALEGQGIGGKLAKAALDYAQDQGLKVIPQCPFVRGYIDRHQEYAFLVP